MILYYLIASTLILTFFGIVIAPKNWQSVLLKMILAAVSGWGLLLILMNLGYIIKTT